MIRNPAKCRLFPNQTVDPFDRWCWCGPGKIPSGTCSSKAARSLDYSKSMTGRIGSDAYNVTAQGCHLWWTSIHPHINKFIAGLYKQNNGYTVVGVKVTAQWIHLLPLPMDIFMVIRKL